FFFSSRRRHTRLVSDWSSDVCSSDLKAPDRPFEPLHRLLRLEALRGILIGRCDLNAPDVVACGLRRVERHGRRLMAAQPVDRARSEERRVGKEWRSWWAAEHEAEV